MRLLRMHLGADAMLEPGMLRAAGKRDILLRMLLNLKRAYVRLRSLAQAHAVTELLVALDPAALNELRDRGLLASQLHDYASALRDLETWLRLAPAGEEERDERNRCGTTSRTCAGAWRRSTSLQPSAAFSRRPSAHPSNSGHTPQCGDDSTQVCSAWCCR